MILNSEFLTNEKCLFQRSYANIPAWHGHGYFGEGIVIFHDDLGMTSHNECCKDIMQVILPKAKIYSGKISSASKDGVITSCNVSCNETGDFLPFDDFVKKYGINQINNSTTGGRNNNESAMAKYMRQKILDHNLVGTGSYGNFSDEPSNRYQGAFIMVSGVTVMKDGSFADYGVSGPDCDFSMFMGYQSGTSFSAPFLNGMIGLLRSKYGMITQAQAYEYLVEHCQDLGEAGKDIEFGYGIPVLGEAEMKIVMQIGSKSMFVDGKEQILDQAPTINPLTRRTLGPVRAVYEAMGAKVEYEESTKTITVIK